MMTNPVNSLSIYNLYSATSGWMSAANARINLARGVNFGSSNYGLLCEADKNLALQMLNDSFKYQAYSALADSESEKKRTDDNIKR